jgi:hypothetical protein
MVTQAGLTLEAEGHRKTTQHGILNCLAEVRGPCKPWRGAAQLGASGNTNCCCSCCRYSLLLNVHEAPKSRKRRQGPALDVHKYSSLSLKNQFYDIYIISTNVTLAIRHRQLPCWKVCLCIGRWVKYHPLTYGLNNPACVPNSLQVATLTLEIGVQITNSSLHCNCTALYFYFAVCKPFQCYLDIYSVKNQWELGKREDRRITYWDHRGNAIAAIRCCQ